MHLLPAILLLPLSLLASSQSVGQNCEAAENCWNECRPATCEAQCTTLQDSCTPQNPSTTILLQDTIFSPATHSITSTTTNLLDDLLNILNPLLNPLLSLINKPCLQIYDACIISARDCTQTLPPITCDGSTATCEDWKRAICGGRLSLDMLPDFPVLDVRKQCDWFVAKLCRTADCKGGAGRLCGLLPGLLLGPKKGSGAAAA